MSNTQRLGSVWKGRAWDDGEPVPRVTLPDGTLAEAMASLGYGWNATASAFQRVAIDNATGGLNVNIVGGSGPGGGGAATIADGADVAQGTTTDLSSANTVIGILKAIKAAITGTLTTTTSWATAQHVIVDTAPTTAVTGPLTDTQLRATPVSVSGTVTATTGGLTDTQLRASAVPISLATAPSTPVTGTFWQSTQPVSAASLPLPSGAATDASITAALGSSTATDVPSAWTALDQLNRIRKLETQNVALLTQLVALQTPKPALKVQPTLLHRS